MPKIRHDLACCLLFIPYVASFDHLNLCYCYFFMMITIFVLSFAKVICDKSLIKSLKKKHLDILSNFFLHFVIGIDSPAHPPPPSPPTSVKAVT